MVGSRVIRFWYVGWIIRMLGVESWGQITYAITAITFLSLFLEGGKPTAATLQQIGTLEGDKRFFTQLVWVRQAATLPLFLFLQVALWLFPFEGSTALSIYACWLLLRPFTLDWLYTRHHRNGIPQVLQLARNAFLLLCVYTIKPSGISQVLAIELSLEFLVVVALWIGSRRLVPNLYTPPHFSHGLQEYVACAPFLASAVFSLLHQNGDILVIRQFLGFEAVGVYDFLYKIMLFVFYAGGGLTLALRPRLAESRLQNRLDLLRGRTLAAQKFLFLGSLAYLAGVWYASQPLVDYFLPGHTEEGVAILRALSLYIPLAFFNIPLVEWLLVHKPPRVFAVMTILMGTSNILLNLLLVPRFGLFGAAITTIAIELSIAIFLFFSTRKDGLFRNTSLRWALPFLLISGIILLAPERANQPFVGLALAVTAILISWLFGLFRRDDLRTLSGRESDNDPSPPANSDAAN